MEEKVILVDVFDRPVGEMEKLEAHQKAKLHRAVSGFVLTTDGKMLIQQRAFHKYHSPGLWTNAVCTHPMPGEDTTAAVLRRLTFEMGICAVSAAKLFDFTYCEKFDNGLTEYEFDHVFVIFSDTLPVVNLDEVFDYQYIELDELVEMVSLWPDRFTAWFKLIVERVVLHLQALYRKSNAMEE